MYFEKWKVIIWAGICNRFSDGELAMGEERKIGDFFDIFEKIMPKTEWYIWG